jgi:soluble lytic murein transglycosylase
MKKLISLLLLFASGAFAEPQDEVFLDAREAFQRGEIARLERQAAELKEDYPLRAYVEYWILRSRLNDSDGTEVEEFLDQHKGDLVAERLRADWLRQLATRGKWDEFLRQYSELGTPDAELACRAAQGRMLKGEAGALSQARSQWFTAQVLPDGCQPLFKAMFDLQILSVDDTWARIRLTLESGNVSAAKRLVGYLPADQRREARDLAEIGRRPLRHLDRTPLPLKTQAQRELAIYALYRHAATAPKNAVERLRAIAPHLSQNEQHYAWAQVATVAARNLHPEAHNWFTEPARMNDRQLTWQARSSLRAGDWSGVLSAIEAMTAPERKLPQWRYWKARALAALSRQDEANELFGPLSNEFNYYGQLAAEEVGTSMSFAPQTYRPEPEDVEAAAAEPGIRRALQYYWAGLRYEGALEWQWTIREYDDKQLLAAAELAMRNDWFERAIDTAERTVLLHDFSLRYPTPYRTLVQYNAQQLGLDEAWIYGLVRQESRFVHTARSSAGASGLMQLMPSTARWAARRLGLNRHHATLTETVDTNISMGTFYLKQVLDSLGDNLVMASAGYNAGPGRAREWLADRPLEGAIYVESIPFPETREYVKRVMNNALYYSRLFREPGPSLRERLGTVPARELQRN